MSETTTCQPWCDNHDDEDGECRTLRRVFDAGDYPVHPADNLPPELAPLGEKLQALSSALHPEPDTVFLEASYAPEEDHCRVSLEFWDSKKEVTQSKLWTSLDGLKALHAAIGRFIAETEADE